MKSYLFLFLLCLTPQPGFCANPSEDSLVRVTIDMLFDGMRKGDSTMIRNAVYDELTLKTCYKSKAGETKLQEEQLIDFLEAVGTPHDVLWDERIHDVEIRIDDRLAMAWVPYEFYLDGTYSHEGVNIFQLILIDKKWKIISITDTRRVESVKD